MPRLLLLRHAKAQRGEGGGDHDRVLAERGVRDAAAMGAVMAERFGGIDAVFCSTSARTRQTWDEVSKALNGGPEATFLRDIYEAGGDYMDILRRHGGSAKSLLLVGHNPTIQATALALSASAGGEAGLSLARKFPTAALAVFEIEGDWAALQPGGAQLREFVVPPGAMQD